MHIPAILNPSERVLALARPALLLLLLLLLHAALWQGPLTLAGKSLLLGHFGAVLLWQPLVSGEQKFSLAGTLALVLALGVLGVFLSWGVLTLWGLVLVGFFGGKVLHHAPLRVRLVYWLALIDVVVMLVGLMLPHLLAGVRPVPEALTAFASWFVVPVGGLIAVLGVLPREPARGPYEVDVVGAVVIVLVLMGVLLGALAFMFVAGSDYVTALLQALATMAATLVLLALVWGPRRGFAGLGLVVARRLLSGGPSFALWLRAVADLAQRETEPAALVAGALRDLLDWPWVSGLRWMCAEAEGAPAAEEVWQACGEMSAHVMRLTHGALTVEIHSRAPLGTTPAWHFDLMVQILAEFHAAKVQAQRLQALSFLRAVHETGARTTHEIKNLLQSLDMLCHAVEHAGERDPAVLQALLGAQLPAIRERLSDAVQRIRQPRADDLRLQPAARWWAALQARHVGACLHYVAEGELDGVSVPAALFDCVADNVLRNALEKASGAVRVSLRAQADGGCLTICNDGPAIPAARAARLFVVPLASDLGLGIGLYQAGRLAESVGYRLTLDENRDGAVCFGLRPKRAA